MMIFALFFAIFFVSTAQAQAPQEAPAYCHIVSVEFTLTVAEHSGCRGDLNEDYVLVEWQLKQLRRSLLRPMGPRARQEAREEVKRLSQEADVLWQKVLYHAYMKEARLVADSLRLPEVCQEEAQPELCLEIVDLREQAAHEELKLLAQNFDTLLTRDGDRARALWHYWSAMQIALTFE